MDRAAFTAHAAAFAARTAAARDGWRWNAVVVGRAAGREGEGYLSKEDNSVDVDVGDEKQQHDDDEKRHDYDEKEREGEKGHDDEEKGRNDEKEHDDDEKGLEGEELEEEYDGTELEEEQPVKRSQLVNGQHRGERGVQPKTREHGRADAVDTELLEDDASDIATLRLPRAGGVLRLNMTYHVLWSPVYAVPVMYLFCTHASGQPADLATVQRALERLGGGVDLGTATNFPSVLLEEHPLLHVPAYCLHPCGTPQLLQDVSAAVAADAPVATNPIVTWLSFVGPQVGLRIPLAYLQGP